MRLWRPIVGVVASAFMFVAGGEGTASATDSNAPIAIGEVTPPPAIANTDAAALRDVAELELRSIDASKLPDRRRVVVSFAMIRAVAEGPVVFTVNAMVRDAKTGAMIAIIEAGAHAEGTGTASAELRRQVAHAAMKSAVRRIPRALGGK